MILRQTKFASLLAQKKYNFAGSLSFGSHLFRNHSMMLVGPLQLFSFRQIGNSTQDVYVRVRVC